MSETPNGGRIEFVAVDGTRTDVTVEVQTVYDLATSSLDMGSGFWSIEDTVPVANLELVCGFENNAQEYVAERIRKDNERALHNANLAARRREQPWLLEDGNGTAVIYPDGSVRNDIDSIRLDMIPLDRGDSVSPVTFTQGTSFTVIFKDGTQIKIG